MFDNLQQSYKEGNFKVGSDEEKQHIDNIVADIDFHKIFNFLFETMRGLLIYAKEGDFDKLFIEENLVP